MYKNIQLTLKRKIIVKHYNKNKFQNNDKDSD
jgi:hypothetical protein